MSATLIAAQAAPTCYSVQLLSLPLSREDALLKRAWPKDCKVMRIGRAVTVRCGCYSRFAPAKKRQEALLETYKGADVVTSYRYRFDQNATGVAVESNVQNRDRNATQEAKTVRVKEEGSQAGTEEKGVARFLNDFEKSVPEEEAVDRFDVPSDKPKHEKIRYVRRRPPHFRYQDYLRALRAHPGGAWDYRYRFGGQVSYDAAYVDEADDKYFDHDFRRIRLFHEGSFWDDALFYQLEYSVTGVNHYKDLYIGAQYDKKGKPYWRLKAGNIKIPFSLEGYTSSKYLTFMERSLAEAYAENRKLGVEALTAGKIAKKVYGNFFVHAFSRSVDERLDGKEDHPGFGTRATLTYKASKNRTMMIGGAWMRQNYRDDKIKINQSVESDLDDHKYASVKIKHVDHVDRANVELYTAYKKAYVQGEYTMMDIYARKGDYRYSGYYVQAGYFLEGQGRRFRKKTATFGRIRPLRRLGDMEVAFRYAHIDLNDKDEQGGSQSDYTFAFNWYMTPEWRLMFNYVLAYPKDTDEYDGMLQVFQGRLLFSF